jgi:uncharacterized protein with PQ loop repeat
MNYGIAALLFGIPAFIPQVIKLYKTNNTKGFSSRTILLYSLSLAFYILHGIKIADNVIIYGSLINLICFLYIIYKSIRNNDFDPISH